MDNPTYVMLTRQSGLMREMQMLAHNIANISTTGFRREGVVFSEYVHSLGRDEASLSMALGNTRHTWQTQGAMNQTNAPFDLAIEGEGFFLLETANGLRLTRAGSFTPNAASELVNMDGHRVLDAGGGPIFVPPDAHSVGIARDGSISADGQPLGQVGLVRPAEPVSMRREAGTLFTFEGDLEPVEQGQVLQGFVEDSNVDALSEMARMIAVQRAYEAGQSLLEREDERIRNVIQTLGR